VEEYVFHIELLNQSGVRCGESEHHADGDQFYNWPESLIVVHSRALSEVSENSASLVAVESSIGEEIMCEDPLISDDIEATGPENKLPCPIAHQGLILLHSRAPVRIDKGGADRGQNGGRR
jgi:hypothetical protein